MFPYKKQLDFNIQISIYENISIATFYYSNFIKLIRWRRT